MTLIGCSNTVQSASIYSIIVSSIRNTSRASQDVVKRKLILNRKERFLPENKLVALRFYPLSYKTVDKL